MTKVAYVAPPVDLKGRFDKLTTPLYKTRHSSLRFTGGLTPPRKKINTSQKSLLPQIRDMWNSLSQADQEQWRLRGLAQNYNAWNTFVQDTSYRIKYGLPGTAVPELLHSYKVGQINMPAAPSNFKLVQEHPILYYKMKKVKGTKSQYEPVAIEEVLLLPLTVGCNFRSNLTAVGPNPYAKFYAQITRSYQGLDLTSQTGFNIPLVSGWSSQEQSCLDVVGHARWYTLVFELNDVQGTLEFDCIRAAHTGTNWARDFRSTNIGAGYSNTNYQLPPSWAADEATPGVTFDSVYPSDAPL